MKIFSTDGRSQKFYSVAKAVILLITSCRKGSRIIRHFCSHFPDYDERMKLRPRRWGGGDIDIEMVGTCHSTYQNKTKN